SMTYGHLVTVSVAGSDRYGRTIGTLYLQGEDVNRLMVARGMAWAYRAYLQDQAMVELEAKAKAMRLGLWVDPNPVAPWQ
ncbi:thermonuclease family protein, partial [Acinetobacter baumannii]